MLGPNNIRTKAKISSNITGQGIGDTKASTAKATTFVTDLAKTKQRIKSNYS
jgi:hypothetical protein